MMLLLGSMIGATTKTDEFIADLKQRIEDIQSKVSGFPTRPKIYFEEWNDPLISGIRWVSELIEIAGGRDCFPELGQKPLGKERIIADPQEVVKRQPDIIVGSWCGKKFRPEQVKARPNWEQVPAVANGFLYEIKSAEILQPGPAALTDGLSRLHQIVIDWHSR